MNRKGLIALVGSLLAVVIAGSAAWACTESADLDTVGRSSGAPGASVTVEGTAFNPGRVDIRWDTSTGPVLASGEGPEFTLTVTIPANTPPAVHYLVGTQDGSRNPAAPFVVRVAQTASVPDAGPAQTPAGDPSPQPSPSPTPPPASAREASSPIEQQGSTSAARQEPATTTPRAAGPATGRRTIGPPAGGAAVTPSPAVPAAVEATSASPSQGSPVPPEADGAIPPARSATSDLWSGFAQGDGAGPSLATRFDGSRTSSSQPALGIALVIIAMAGTVGGFAVMGVQRRRAKAVAHG